jgi:hypothetical protein
MQKKDVTRHHQSFFRRIFFTKRKKKRCICLHTCLQCQRLTDMYINPDSRAPYCICSQSGINPERQFLLKFQSHINFLYICTQFKLVKIFKSNRRKYKWLQKDCLELLNACLLKKLNLHKGFVFR